MFRVFSASSVVGVTQWEAHSGPKAALRSRETPRPLCLYIAFRPRFVLLAFCLMLVYLVRVSQPICIEICLLKASVELIVTLAPTPFSIRRFQTEGMVLEAVLPVVIAC